MAVKVVVVARAGVSSAPLGEPFRVLTKEAAEKVRLSLSWVHRQLLRRCCGITLTLQDPVFADIPVFLATIASCFAEAWATFGGGISLFYLSL